MRRAAEAGEQQRGKGGECEEDPDNPAQALSEARKTATNATSEASTMRQMALPREESGAKSCRSASSGDTPSWAARAASKLGVRSVRVVPGWMQLTVIP